MHYVGKIDWSFADTPAPPSDDRLRPGPDADRRAGAGRGPHGPCRRSLEPGGWLAPHVHSFEEALYVLEGELLVEIDGRIHRLVARRLRPDPDRHCATPSATRAQGRPGSSR